MLIFCFIVSKGMQLLSREGIWSQEENGLIPRGRKAWPAITVTPMVLFETLDLKKLGVDKREHLGLWTSLLMLFWMQRNAKAELTIMQLYSVCLLKYQSLLCTAIPFLKFIVLEKCCSSLILTFSAKSGGRWEVFELYGNPHETFQQHSGAFFRHPAHSLSPQIQIKFPPPRPALILTANIKRASTEAKARKKIAQGCWIQAVWGGLGSPGAVGWVWSPSLRIDIDTNSQ